MHHGSGIFTLPAMLGATCQRHVMPARLPANSLQEMVLKYQLPGHSMEELISLRSNDDLEEFKVRHLPDTDM